MQCSVRYCCMPQLDAERVPGDPPFNMSCFDAAVLVLYRATQTLLALRLASLLAFLPFPRHFSR